jgi:hypothetical protein
MAIAGKIDHFRFDRQRELRRRMLRAYLNEAEKQLTEPINMELLNKLKEFDMGPEAGFTECHQWNVK